MDLHCLRENQYYQQILPGVRSKETGCNLDLPRMRYKRHQNKVLPGMWQKERRVEQKVSAFTVAEHLKCHVLRKVCILREKKRVLKEELQVNS